MQIGRAEVMRKEKKMPDGVSSFVFPTTRCWSFCSVCIWLASDFIPQSFGRNYYKPVQLNKTSSLLLNDIQPGRMFKKKKSDIILSPRHSSKFLEEILFLSGPESSTFWTPANRL